jgi:hypothetical protein
MASGLLVLRNVNERTSHCEDISVRFAVRPCHSKLPQRRPDLDAAETEFVAPGPARKSPSEVKVVYRLTKSGAMIARGAAK